MVVGGLKCPVETVQGGGKRQLFAVLSDGRTEFVRRPSGSVSPFATIVNEKTRRSFLRGIPARTRRF